MKSKYLTLIFLLLIQLVAINVISYDYKTNNNYRLDVVSKIPVQINNWKGTDHPLDPKVYDLLETRAIVHRSYRNEKGQEVFLSIVYYTETKVDFHAPEACLGGQGIKTTKSPAEVKISVEKDSQQVLTVNQLIQEGETGKNTLVYYFYKTGSFMGSSYLNLRFNLVLNKFGKGNNSGSLIRVSTVMEKAVENNNVNVLMEQFINQIIPYIIMYL